MVRHKSTVYDGTPPHKQFEQTEEEIERQKQKAAEDWKEKERQGQSQFRKKKKIGEKGF